MSLVAAGFAFVAILLSGQALSPPESADAGKRVESDSYTAPREIVRCIAYNIGRKRPDLHVRSSAGDTPEESAYLILTDTKSSPTPFGVIRVAYSEVGSHLTTWLSDKSLSAAPSEIAQRLIAGC